MPKPTYVITADSARARLFRIEGVDPRGVPKLVEVSSLVHPEARIPQSQRFTDSKPDSFPAGSHHHTFDDHRDAHEDEDRRRFARHVAVTLNDLLQVPCETIVFTTHAMQAPLREAMERLCPRAHVGLHTGEHTRSSPHELGETIQAAGLLRHHAAE